MDASLELRVGAAVVFSSAGRWLHPLFELSEFLNRAGFDITAAELRDKVVGRGSAFLIVRLGIQRVHAALLSRLGKDVLDRAGIAITWDTLVDRITCATETLLEGVTDAGEAYHILAERRAAAVRRSGEAQAPWNSSHDPNTHRVRSGQEEPLIRILCLCVHNSARSQIAEAYVRKFGGDFIDAESAGLEPGVLNPLVVRALGEDGIDISDKRTQDVFSLYKAGRTYRYVITVCSADAAERCPIFPGRSEKLHWPFPDPSTFTGTDAQLMVQMREVRDAIKEKVSRFVEELRARTA